MAKVTFRTFPHDIYPNTSMVEVLIDGQMCAAIYPLIGEKGIKIVSAHFAEMSEEGTVADVAMDPLDPRLPVPSFSFRFDPQPYAIEGGRIVKKKPQ